MATKMKMVSKGGKMVPSFAADGKGKMKMGGTKKYQNGGSAGQSISSKGAYYPDAKCRAEGCPKNPNSPKYKKEVSKLTPAEKQKIGAKYQRGGASRATGVDNMTTNTTSGQRLNFPTGVDNMNTNTTSGQRLNYKTGVDNMNTNTTAGQKLNYKTGGMVNSNAKVSALKSAGSKGVKSGVNPKAAASKVAKGKVGGTSKAPKTASPKMKMGGAMKRKSK
jgi:hypothetical protein